MGRRRSAAAQPRQPLPSQAMSAAAAAAAPGGSEALQAEAFQRLYPDQYLAKFVAQGVRPDGRPLALPRATSIGLGVVTTADASALVKIGSTTVLAGAKCEVMPASADEPDKGRLVVQVEMAPLCSAECRPGRPSEAAQALGEQLGALMEGAGVVDRRQLCIDAGKAAWAVYLDLYVLDADGSLYDACLLAALATLASLRLHAVTVDDAGRIHKAGEDGAAAAPAAVAQQRPGSQQQGAAPPLRSLQLDCQPVSLTCGVYRGQLLVDPTAEEEPLLEALLTATVDEQGDVLGFYKAGGSATASQQRVLECIEAAKMRGKEVRGLLQQALEAAGVADGGAVAAGS
ncbi:hypothetical protein ABPG75_008464 [Micractinium tetrahymenae]